MTYDSPRALRTALEARIGNEAAESGLSVDRLRRRVMFQRVVTRLQRAEPGRWVVKGGMAMEVRLRDRARLTKDLDLGLRVSSDDGDDLRERLIDALGQDQDNDGFNFSVGGSSRLTEDEGGEATWRVTVGATLANRNFGTLKLDISPRAHELDATDVVELPNTLSFAGVTTVKIEIVDVHRHAAEKFHGMLKDFGERENTRVRDLADIVLLIEAGLLAPGKLAESVVAVWTERNRAAPPTAFPALPPSWPGQYEALAGLNGIEPASFVDAEKQAAALWAQMFSTNES